jgi:hypothetical protein
MDSHGREPGPSQRAPQVTSLSYGTVLLRLSQKWYNGHSFLSPNISTTCSADFIYVFMYCFSPLIITCLHYMSTECDYEDVSIRHFLHVQ